MSWQATASYGCAESKHCRLSKHSLVDSDIFYLTFPQFSVKPHAGSGANPKQSETEIIQLTVGSCRILLNYSIKKTSL